MDASERFIDSQYATSTIYRGTTMGGDETMFGFRAPGRAFLVGVRMNFGG